MTVIKDTNKYGLVNYTVGETIGEGSFAKVRKGIDKRTGEMVALKFVEHDKLKTTIGLNNFFREAAIHEQLDHPNICKLIEVVEMPERGYTCLVVEYIEGKDLLDVVMDSNGLSEDKAQHYFRQIASAVSYLHQTGIVHRDLKLENVMITKGDTCKLIDFGLATTWSPSSLLKTPCGSAFYAAPEIIDKKSYVGPKTDVWALGVVLYSMITATIPWPGETERQQMSNAAKGVWSAVPNMSIDIENILTRCLYVEPEKRAGILDIIEHPWLNQKSLKRKGSGSLMTLVKRSISFKA